MRNEYSNYIVKGSIRSINNNSMQIIYDAPTYADPCQDLALSRLKNAKVNLAGSSATLDAGFYTCIIKIPFSEDS